jgi:prepilin-type N-terminal cleavage/methylation domain-containing protein
VRSLGRARRDPGRSDGGFTLAEVLIALTLIGVVGSFAVGFQVNSMSIAREQADRQAAAQLLAQGVDEARKTGGAALLAEPALAAPTPTRLYVGRTEFRRAWTAAACVRDAGVSCSPAALAAARPGVPRLARVQVTVTWQDADDLRSEQAVALLNAETAEPVFAP